MNKSSNAPVGSRLSFAVLNVGHRCMRVCTCACVRALEGKRKRQGKINKKKKEEEKRKIGRNLVGSGNFS